jgi:hypothetical protein
MQVMCRSLPKPSASPKREENAEVSGAGEASANATIDRSLISVYAELRKKKAFCAQNTLTVKVRLVAPESRAPG